MKILTEIRAFKGMSDAEFQLVEEASQIVDLRDSDQVFAQGDPGDAVYAIVGGEGRIRIGAIGKQSKGLMVEIFKIGDLFGEVAVISGGVRTATAISEGRIGLARINAPTFLRLLGTSPTLGANLSRILAERLRRTYELFQTTTFDNLEVRLARQLLYLAHRDGLRSSEGLRLAGRFREADLADLLGTTSRSIITILNAWRSSGVVAYDTRRAVLTICREADLRMILESCA
jgi:CRP/FNR family transcriptional regulator, cyclic AMP receptor protein